MEEPIIVFDLTRMLLGDQPPFFLIEIAFRTAIIYIYTLALIRWIGSRSIAQLSLVEFLLVIALGSAVGDAMFYPDVPLLHCIVVITGVVLLDKGLSFLVARSARIEDAIEGKTAEVVRDGRIQCEEIRRLSFGHDELFEQLRLHGIRHLGEVEAAYLETNGQVSVFKTEQKDGTGLSIFPPWDVESPETMLAGDMSPLDTTIACPQCAHVLNIQAESTVPRCPVCARGTWHRQDTTPPDTGASV